MSLHARHSARQGEAWGRGSEVRKHSSQGDFKSAGCPRVQQAQEGDERAESQDREA